MIPFARILNYGNTVVPAGSDIEIYSTTNSLFVFRKSTQQLYGMGSSGNSLGLNNPLAVNSLTLLSNNVERVISNIDGGVNFFMYLSTDGKIYAAGTDQFMTNGVAGNAYNTWTDISSIFTAVNIPDIKGAQCYYGDKLNLIMNDGSLYCAGTNDVTKDASFGTGNNVGTNRVLAKVPITNVVAVDGNMYLQSNGDLYACGTNTYYQYGNNSTTSSASLVKVASNVREIGSGYRCNYYINNLNELRVCGSAFSLGTGNEMGTGAITVNRTWVKVADGVANMTTCRGNMALHYILQSGTLLSTGYNTNGCFGIGAGSPNTIVPVGAIPQPPTSSNSQISRGNIFTTVTTDTGVYIAGKCGDVVVTNSFIPLTLPW